MKQVLIFVGLLMLASCVHQDPPVAPPQPKPEPAKEKPHQVCVTYQDGALCVRTITLPNGVSKMELIRVKGSP